MNGQASTNTTPEIALRSALMTMAFMPMPQARTSSPVAPQASAASRPISSPSSTSVKLKPGPGATGAR
jgi:hypothetical protein